MSDAFTKSDPQDFDADAWITKAKLPERSVTVYGRADLVAEYEDLDQQLADARQSDNADERLADRQGVVARRMDEVRKEMMGSALTIKFRALSKDEQKKIRESAPKAPNGDPDDDFIQEHVVSAASFSPVKFTPEQVSGLRAKVGEGQWLLLWNTALGASLGKPSVPFSVAASVALSSQDS